VSKLITAWFTLFKFELIRFLERILFFLKIVSILRIDTQRNLLDLLNNTPLSQPAEALDFLTRSLREFSKTNFEVWHFFY